MGTPNNHFAVELLNSNSAASASDETLSRKYPWWSRHMLFIMVLHRHQAKPPAKPKRKQHIQCNGILMCVINVQAKSHRLVAPPRTPASSEHCNLAVGACARIVAGSCKSGGNSRTSCWAYSINQEKPGESGLNLVSEFQPDLTMFKPRVSQVWTSFKLGLQEIWILKEIIKVKNRI